MCIIQWIRGDVIILWVIMMRCVVMVNHRNEVIELMAMVGLGEGHV